MQVSIPEPCHESWAEMTPTQQGRHCSACAKTVLDFTKMSDAQLLSHLKKASGQTCGQIRNDQLDRPVGALIYGGIPRWVSACLAFILTILGSAVSFGQQLQIQEKSINGKGDSAISQKQLNPDDLEGNKSTNGRLFDLLAYEEFLSEINFECLELTLIKEPELKKVLPESDAVAPLFEVSKRNRIGNIIVGVEDTQRDFSRFSFRYYLR